MAKTEKRHSPKAAADAMHIPKSPDLTDEAAIASVTFDPLARSLNVSRHFLQPNFGKRSVTESFSALQRKADAVRDGDLSGLERTLVAQADTLDAIFLEMSRKAATNLAEGYLPAGETYMRLALKAQAQTRATIETLAQMKAPPTVIARQANVTTGPQQVNNTVAVRSGGGNHRSTHGRAHAGAENSKTGDQPHEPGADDEADRLDERITALLRNQQAHGLPLPGAGCDRLERMPVPRGEGRGPKGTG
jgi:hypothetical protein